MPGVKQGCRGWLFAGVYAILDLIYLSNRKGDCSMSAKEEFIEIYRENIRRDGADALLDYLEHKSDFFTAPASARFHGAYAGGLCEHSVNVYHCLTRLPGAGAGAGAVRPGVPGGERSHWLPCSTTCARSGCYKAGLPQREGPRRQVAGGAHLFLRGPPALRPRGEERVHPLRLHAPHPGGGHGHPLAHGLLRRRGHPHWWARPSSSIPWPLPSAVADMEATYFLEKEES